MAGERHAEQHHLVMAMLLMMMRWRPIMSEKCPAIGVIAKPAACKENMQMPIHFGG